MSENILLPSTIKAHLPMLGKIDLTVKIDEQLSDCSTLVFTVKLKIIKPIIKAAFIAANPTLRLPSFHTDVEVMAYDDCGIMQFMALEFSAFDQDQTETIALDMPRDSCSPPGGDWKRTFFVLVDPFKKLTETKEGNNFATSTQKCIG